MMVLTFVFAIMNICLGFALAMYLGYGTPGFNKDLNSVGIGSNVGIGSVQTVSESASRASSASPSPADTANQPSPKH